MVFDSFIKIGFPQATACGRFFLSGKSSLFLFFTVKQIFLKIKS